MNVYFLQKILMKLGFGVAVSTVSTTGEAKSNDCLHSDEALINMLRERGYKGELTKTLTI